MPRRPIHRCLAAVTLAAVALAGTGCQSDAGTASLVGAAAGAGLGAIIGHQVGGISEGAVIGAGVGGAAGYLLGNASDREKAKEW